MRIYYWAFLLLFSISTYSFAQEDICIGKKYKVFSNLLQEEREYQVYLPNSYNKNSSDKKYPVIYLTDGESFFHSLTAVHRSFFTERASLMPECIVVGIINTDRTRDLTPTKSAYRRDGTREEGDKELGGGADTFARFLIEELRPLIDSGYKTSGENILFGHSYGGLFVLSVFLQYTDKFDTYIAIDPALWWDNAKLAKDAEYILQMKQFSNKTLYVGIAGGKRPDNRYIHFSVANVFLEETLPKGKEKGLLYYSKVFPDENHGTIPIPGMIDAFRQIYVTPNLRNKFK